MSSWYGLRYLKIISTTLSNKGILTSETLQYKIIVASLFNKQIGETILHFMIKV